MRYGVKKKIIRCICIVLLAAFLLPQSEFESRASSNALTNEYIQGKEEEIRQIEQEQQALQQGITDTKALLEQLKQQQEDLYLYAQQVDAILLELDDKITLLNEQITLKELQIEQTKQELAEAQEVERQQYEAMKVRIRFMYEEGDAYYLEMLFSATGIADMLNKADYIEAVSEYDRRKLEEYILNEHLIEVCQQELEVQEAALQTQKDSVQAEREAQQALREQAAIEIASKQHQIDEEKETLEQQTAKLAAQTETIEALEAQVAAEKKRLQEANQPQQTYDGGAFAWPCPSTKTITSEYGWRRHPVLNYDRFHNGIDIGARHGAPILAAYDGKVVAASYTSAMGNYIMIDHGDGLYTIYMHCSQLYVSEGTYVVRGEQIAAVGATGLVTGAHLHFSVRLNGEYVNPLNYVS
ncbi:MAG: peptidoglycan DD-metalloendopeptidase family protein [Lachnospiraceae bacterium]|nr:peptidoglycan DD-metalloendopeptidase family protein [Lachnospiraceae bacterium]MBD5482575.1 peptidoglycan DD-metalloendopeptidase family protein [Lachnospiraceae bacterium]